MAYCVNRDCPAQKFEALNHFVSQGALDIRGLGPSTLQKMIDLELIADAADLYSLTAEQLGQIPNFKEKSVHNLQAALEASKKRPFESVLFALGIRHVGEGIAALLASQFPEMNSLIEASEEEIGAVAGIGPEIARSVHLYFGDPKNRHFVSRLRKAGLSMIAEAKAAPEGRLAGKTFMITGTLESMPRSGAEKWIRERGGTILASVSKKLDYLVVGAAPGTKLAKARKLGVAEISEEQLMEMGG
jgi:DNA ligase (NAD+)